MAVALGCLTLTLQACGSASVGGTGNAAGATGSLGGTAAGGSSAGSGGLGGSSGSVGIQPLCLQQGGRLDLELAGPLSLTVNATDDVFCSAQSVFGNPTRIGWSIDRDGGVLPVLVTLLVDNFNPGDTPQAATVGVAVVSAAADGGLWESEGACQLEVSINEPVQGGPTINRVEGVVTCNGPLPASSDDRDALNIEDFDFATGVSRGQ